MLSAIALVNLLWLYSAMPVEKSNKRNPNQQLLNLSEELLYKVKMEEPVDSILFALSKYTVEDLAQGLNNDIARNAFWINIYNACYQMMATREGKTPPKIFTDKIVKFADAVFSLDDVEHGILRKYRWKYSLGYLPQFLPSKSIKQLAVANIDFRIHFALNCGAKSCPPIAFYKYDNLETQLELATRSFIENETVVDEENKTVQVSKIMHWFRGDFKGDDGIRQILSYYFGKNLSAYRIRFKEYNWEKKLKNYRVEEKEMNTESTITCPQCGHNKNETMPTDACHYFYQCENCKAVLKPKQGDCCVFCSYGSIKCPPKQLEDSSCCKK